MIASFPTPDIDNIAGCQTFMFNPVQQVANMLVLPARRIITDIALVPGATWNQGYATTRTLTFDEKRQENDAGEYFLTEINGFYPKLSPTVLELFHKMRQQKFIVIVADNNGFKRVCGTLAYPLEFTFDQVSGDKPSARNGFNFRFFCQSIAESPFLVPFPV